MTTTWTEADKYSTQTPVNYNDDTVTYDDTNVLYNGRQETTWTEQTEN